MPGKKSTRIEHDRRVETVRQLILSGLDGARIVPNVSEQWKITDRQARNYVAAARAQIQEITAEQRPYLIAEHISVRRSIRERARQAKDLRAELAASQDEAKLLGLYPAAQVEIEVSDLREKADSDLISEFNELVAAGAASTR